MAHLTAGDIQPIYSATEATYGTIPQPLGYYGDVAEGGAIRFTDTCNPNVAWRYGSRTRNTADYVATQTDDGFTASMEVRDVSGWKQVLTNAYTSHGTSLPSRSVFIGTSVATERHLYAGCKTDSLTVSADAPGGIVKFDETVLAAYLRTDITPTGSSLTDTAAVQWLGGVTIAGAAIYPQSFSLTIRNNLERIRGPTLNPSAVGDTSTIALVEGRCEVSLEMTVWLDDFNYIDEAINNTYSTPIVLTIGSEYPATVTLSDPCHVSDGQNPDLKQDKMTQTLRYNVGSISVA